MKTGQVLGHLFASLHENEFSAIGYSQEVLGHRIRSARARSHTVRKREERPVYFSLWVDGRKWAGKAGRLSGDD